MIREESKNWEEDKKKTKKIWFRIYCGFVVLLCSLCVLFVWGKYLVCGSVCLFFVLIMWIYVVVVVGLVCPCVFLFALN